MSGGLIETNAAPIQRITKSVTDLANPALDPFIVWLSTEPDPYFAFDPLLKIVLAGAIGFRDAAQVSLTVDAARVIHRVAVFQ